MLNIIFQNLKTSHEYFETDWPELCLSTKKQILMIVTASKPIQFTIAKILPLSISSFLKVQLKMRYEFMTPKFYN